MYIYTYMYEKPNYNVYMHNVQPSVIVQRLCSKLVDVC